MVNNKGAGALFLITRLACFQYFFLGLGQPFFGWATLAPKRPGLDTPVAHKTGGIRELSLSLDVACATLGAHVY
jgi:hypothetical protein